MEFIEKAQKVHGDLFNYSQVDYINNASKVIIICKKHGKFFQSPSNHLAGKNGCKLCLSEEVSLNKSSNTGAFIQKALKTHGHKYDYSKTVYVRNNLKVVIICKKHGEFQQTAGNHLSGQGCRLCKNEKLSRDRADTVEGFIAKSQLVHKKYDYSRVIYINAQTPVIINCPLHGDFSQVPMSHVKGVGCPKCGLWKLSKRFVSNTNEFIRKARKVHGEKYCYIYVDYKNARTKTKIHCPKHGVFYQTPNGHLDGRGCPQCVETGGERKIRVFLESHEINYVPYKTFKDCRSQLPLIFDFFLPDLNTIIEYDGEQHFKPVDFKGTLSKQQLKMAFEKALKNDHIKNTYCSQKGINMIRIPYTEFKTIHKTLSQKLSSVLTQNIGDTKCLHSLS